MFDRYEFLNQVRAKAGSQQEVLDVLGLPSSRGPELFNSSYKKVRNLSVEEAIKLSGAFGVPIYGQGVSVAELSAVLAVCLRKFPGKWDTAMIKQLAEMIEQGIQLRRELQVHQKESGRDD